MTFQRQVKQFAPIPGVHEVLEPDSAKYLRDEVSRLLNGVSNKRYRGLTAYNFIAPIFTPRCLRLYRCWL